MILEIEGDYDEILKTLENYVDTRDALRVFKEIPEDKLLELLRNVMKFQRKIELSLESAIKLAGKIQFIERIDKATKKLLSRFISDNVIDKIEFMSVYTRELVEYSVKGVTLHLKLSHKKLLHGDDTECRRHCYCAYFGLKSARSSLIELEEELRLISAITTYPIEKKTQLKNQLVVNDFDEVAVSLEEAESNVEVEHFRDCVSRCRDAVEIFIASVREKETGEKTERHFATDLGKLVKIGVLDIGTQRLVQGVYSFLSVKGSHKYDAKKVSIYDAETSLKETYSILEMLLKKYLDLKREKK